MEFEDMVVEYLNNFFWGDGGWNWEYVNYYGEMIHYGQDCVLSIWFR